MALLWNYDIDIFRHIINAFASGGGAEGAGQANTGTQEIAAGAQAAADSTFLGRIMTGLLVAGGSGAIFNIFTKMGLRDPMQLAQKAQKAREEADNAKQSGQQRMAGGGPPPTTG